MVTSMLGMIGGFELLMILVIMAVFLAMVGGVLALVLWLNRRNGKSAPPPQPPSAAPTKRLCPQCGKEMFATDAPQGLCPSCLMNVAMGSEARNPAAGSPEKQPAPPPDEIAKHFPQFEILTLLGQGGMGAVYKARQPALDRFVALKILPARTAADAGFAERFNREARALAKLSHPNIVAVYEFGQADGLHYLVMEFVDGLNLRQLQQTGKLPPREALEIIPQICEALQFAHDEGVVHRDIKPENVLLDKKGRVKIADFGLARILGHEPESFRLTGTKDYMGTPHYMAPEQIERPQEVDHRADIYSLGVVFYEMLTGELPLGNFAPPSKKVQVDVRLDEVVLHTLEKEPERRYQHAGQVKTDVETIAHTAPPSSTVSLAVVQRRHGLRVKSAVLFFAAACFLVASLSFALSGNGIAAMLSIGAIIGLSLAGYGNFRAASALDAPLSPPVSAQEIERVRRQVKGPAIGLLATGIFNWLLMPAIAFLFLPNAMHSAKTEQFPQLLVLCVTLVPLVLCSFVMYAAFKMMQLERRGAAIAASILAMLVTPGNLIGLPMGIWALVVLSQPKVRQAFGKGHPLPLLGTGPAQATPNPRGGAWNVAAVIAAAVLLVLVVPVGAFLLSITLPYLALQREEVVPDPSGVVRTEAKLRHEIERRLGEGGWRVEGLSVNVTPDFKRAECRLGSIWKNGLTKEPPPHAAILLEPQGSGLWLVRGEGEFQSLRFSVDTSGELARGVNRDARRKFVRIVVDTTRMTFEGQQTTWDDVGPLLADVSDRKNTILEFAVTSDQITVAQQNEWFQKVTALARQHGFEYASFIGIHPLGSKSAVTTHIVPPVEANVAGLGPVIERTLPSVTAQRPIRLLDLDSGDQSELPADREKDTEEQFFHWISERGVDLVAQGHRKAWTLITSLKLASLEESSWSAATPASLREALTTGANGLRREDTVFGYDQYLLETNAALPLTFVFETRQGGLGSLQITGFTASPPGVKIRYKLVQGGGSAYGTPAPEAKPDDVADVPSAERLAGGDINKLYFLIGRHGISGSSKSPAPLLLVLPGGDGGRDFQPFIKRICKNALPDGYLVAQLVAPKWDDNQFARLVWPTEKSRYPAMKFSTEEFVSAVVADIEEQHPVDSRRIFTLSWSSGGPAGYAISLHPNTRVTGSFVAMSVFKPDQLPEFTAAKGHAYYLLHSPTDLIPMRMPELARDTLTSNGAKVHLQTYQGGHGWHGNVFGVIGEGIRWLEQPTTSSSTLPVVANPAQPVVLKTGDKLPFNNVGMEEGSETPAAWQKGSPVAGVEQMWDRTTAHGGKASLCLKKTVQRFFPIAQWSQTVTVEPSDHARKLRVRCWVKAEKVAKAIVDVTYQGKQSGHVWAVFLGQKEQTDPVANHDWKLREEIVEVPVQTSRLGIAFQIYGPGVVWFDDLEVAWVE